MLSFQLMNSFSCNVLLCYTLQQVGQFLSLMIEYLGITLRMEWSWGCQADLVVLCDKFELWWTKGTTSKALLASWRQLQILELSLVESQCIIWELCQWRQLQRCHWRPYNIEGHMTYLKVEKKIDCERIEFTNNCMVQSSLLNLLFHQQFLTGYHELFPYQGSFYNSLIMRFSLVIYCWKTGP